jgi:hypothetical protein
MSCGCLALGDVQTPALQSSAFRLSNIASIFCAGIFSKKKTSYEEKALQNVSKMLRSGGVPLQPFVPAFLDSINLACFFCVFL